MEVDLYGTSLGYGHVAGRVVPHGHEHHLRTINRIRAVGSIEAAVRSGVIKTGIMAACVRRGAHVVMAGTIRDDGPLPGVITDSVEAQASMRAAIPGIGLALLVASTLHAVATGNLLPATTPSVSRIEEVFRLSGWSWTPRRFCASWRASWGGSHESPAGLPAGLFRYRIRD
jgi:hypothetical protein